MSRTIRVHDPRGYPPEGRREAAGAAAGQARRQDDLSRRLPVRQLRRLHVEQLRHWFGEHLPGDGRRASIAPKESWVDDPGHACAHRGRRRRGHPRRRSLKHVQPDGRRARDGARSRRRADRRRAHARVRASRAIASPRANGMPTLRQAFVPQPVVGRTPAELRAYIEGTDPINSRPFIAGDDRGADAAARRRQDLAGLVLRPLDAPAARRRHARTICTSCFRESAGPTSCRSCCRPRSASRRCSPGTSHARRRGRRPPASDRLPRVVGVHGREGGGQRRHGGRAPRVPAGHPRDGGERRDGRVELARRRRRPSRSSTVRSATRSA